MISDRDIDDKNDSVGLCFWTIFQATGITCVAIIVLRSIFLEDGFFDIYSQNKPLQIYKNQFSNWHYSLTTFGFIYLYANSKCRNMTIQLLQYIIITMSLNENEVDDNLFQSSFILKNGNMLYKADELLMRKSKCAVLFTEN